MTNEEGILVNEICNDYWTGFSQLIAAHLKRVPPHLRDEVLMMFQDRSSCYGSAYSDFLNRETPLINTP